MTTPSWYVYSHAAPRQVAPATLPARANRTIDTTRRSIPTPSDCKEAHVPARLLLRSCASCDCLDDLDQLVEAVAVLAGELDEFPGVLDHGALLGRSGDGDATATAELEETLIP
jgi:hypothetical protein